MPATSTRKHSPRCAATRQELESLVEKISSGDDAQRKEAAAALGDLTPLLLRTIEAIHEALADTSLTVRLRIAQGLIEAKGAGWYDGRSC